MGTTCPILDFWLLFGVKMLNGKKPLFCCVDFLLTLGNSTLGANTILLTKLFQATLPLDVITDTNMTSFRKLWQRDCYHKRQSWVR